MYQILNNIHNIEYLWYIIFIISKLNIFDEGENIFNQYNFYYKLIITLLLLYYFNYFSKIEVNLHGEDVTRSIKSVAFTAGLIMIFEIIYKSFNSNLKKSVNTRKKIKRDFIEYSQTLFK
tara:strand:- start:909 stop:1268 length:360 start_codon:yes stop_codon:yes gene_type:complete